MNSEIAIRFDNTSLMFDVVIDDRGDFTAENGLHTAVVLSLFCDARAQPGDNISDGTTSRRGWWGDSFSDFQGDRFGSRLWLLSRSKTTDETVELARVYATESLQWLVDDGVARQVTVTVERLHDSVLVLNIAIYRANEPPVKFRFENFWSAIDAI